MSVCINRQKARNNLMRVAYFRQVKSQSAGKISFSAAELPPSLSNLPCRRRSSKPAFPLQRASHKSIETFHFNMVSQTNFSGAGGVQAVAGLHEDYFGYMDRNWRLCCGKMQHSDADARSDGSARTMDEATDLEVLAYMAATDCSYVDKYDDHDECCSPRSGVSNVSGLPLVCSNCGVSFFSLQIPDDQVDCYCSGECKWSVIMYREMDLRMYAMRRTARRHTVHSTTRPTSSYYSDSDDEERDDGSVVSFSFSDDSTASSSCS
ncbi:hypothetical protein L917_13736 [Phytophthora nicotianae]|uniref:Uncharacterized protein n=1 Tax=Phytophthora nicotianae TaxID=4792 RepID=W2KNV6_PHYNI|nr:hypothetical protein L917_13736 [Phytophthora nicotianae]